MARTTLNLISRGDAKFIQCEHLIYFRDVYDHKFRISETIDLERDMMSGTMEAYLSVIAAAVVLQEWMACDRLTGHRTGRGETRNRNIFVT
ncbi:MAG: hypothetical protein ACXVJT_03755 [Thermoanaerobaculia bacterium]